MGGLIATQSGQLALADYSLLPARLDTCPAFVYVRGLASPSSRRTVAAGLNDIVKVCFPTWESDTGLRQACEIMLSKIEAHQAASGADSYPFPPAVGNQHHGKRKGKEYQPWALMLHLVFPWASLTPSMVQIMRADIIHGVAVSTANLRIAALRRVLQAAEGCSSMAFDTLRRCLEILKPAKGAAGLRGRALEAYEVGRLYALAQEDCTERGYRNAAILACMYPTGLRRAEIASLNIEDVSIESGDVTVSKSKDGISRTVYLANGALDALRDWIAVRGQAAGPFFWQAHQNGTVIPDTRISPDAVYRVACRLQAADKEAAEKLGYQPMPDFSPHDFRRTIIGDLLSKGVDISTVQQLAGHSSVSTTQRYDRRGEGLKKAAMASVEVPYQRRKISSQ